MDRFFCVLLLLVCVVGCKTSKQTSSTISAAPKGPPPPKWVTHIDVEAGKLCGLGVAGAAFDKDSPYPKTLSKERAVHNLAGALETTVQEAIIERTTNRGSSIDTVRVITVDEELLKQVAAQAEVDYWLDAGGTGPFAQKGFTYAHACMDASVVSETFHLEANMLTKRMRKKPVRPNKVPKWIHKTGRQPGGRLCAVGFSLPTFHPEKTFENVVEDVRAQLSKALRSLVASYHEELTTDRFQYVEMMTLATTEAVSKGAVVTDFWYDRDGKGHFKKKRSTYGRGCVYPVDLMKKSLASVEQQLPKNVVEQVRKRAENAFNDLDREIDKRENTDVSPVSPQSDQASSPPNSAD